MTTSQTNLPVKRDIGALVDAICEAYVDATNGGRWESKYIEGHGWVTYCNEAVNYVAKAFEYKKFDKPNTVYPHDAILANQQFDILADQAGDWIKVTGKMGQDLANEGALVIAAWKNPDGGAGHVCVLRPGHFAHSGTWKTIAPKCLNIGKSTFIDKKASWAFRSEPKYFVLKDLDGK